MITTIIMISIISKYNKSSLLKWENIGCLLQKDLALEKAGHHRNRDLYLDQSTPRQRSRHECEASTAKHFSASTPTFSEGCRPGT